MKNEEIMKMGKVATRKMYSDKGYKPTKKTLLYLWKKETDRDTRLRLARLLRFLEELRDAE